MKKNLYITPEGTKDYLFKECTSVNLVCDRVQSVFENHYFHQVFTPTLEYYDLFANESSGITQESMFKSTDNKGKIIVARPDSTLPIARMVATRLQNEIMPVRLFYKQCVFRNNPSLTGKCNEMMQMGVELIGSQGKRADLEVITTAIEAMEAVTDDFRVEIGHSMLFASLVNSLKTTDSIKEDIKTYIENKNYSALNNLLDKLQQDDTVTSIRKLPSLFGGVEIFDKALTYIKNKDALVALDYLKDLYSELQTLGLEDKIIVDLGLVQRNDYYSGIIFSGYVPGCGDAVLSGGRYDKIFDMFNCEIGASGFAVNIDYLANEARHSVTTNVPDVLVVAKTEDNTMKAISVTKELVAKGIKAQFSVVNTEQEARIYAEKLGINEVQVIGE